MGYRVSVELNASYCKDIIKSILQKGADLGFVYYLFSLKAEWNPLDIDAATKAVIEGDPDSELHALTIQMGDTYTSLLFIEDKEKLIVMFSCLGCGWLKTFYDGNTDQDMVRYGKVMIDLVSDFKIINMELSHDKW